jgi:predicted AAA+ superfamily ATPase
MFSRDAVPAVRQLLAEFPAVALIGPRQVGKTTLARELAGADPGAVYVDLELPSHRARLDDPEAYLRSVADRRVILDEVQVAEGLFPVLRGMIDEDPRPGRFLLLGSASPRLLQRSSETLAGRIALHELAPLGLDEIRDAVAWRMHWWRGGFPRALTAAGDAPSRRWAEQFLRTYVEREIVAGGGPEPGQALSRLLRMIAHRHGQPWTGEQLAGSLGVSAPTVARGRDRLEDAFLLRLLPPLHRNLGKRLVKKPKVYVRDSGLLHALLQVPSADALHGHPVLGASFEGYVIEEVAKVLGEHAALGYWRSHGGAEIDLVIEVGVQVTAAVEIKYASAPSPARGFFEARKDLGDPPGWIVHPGTERWRVSDGVEAVGVEEFLGMVRGLAGSPPR